MKRAVLITLIAQLALPVQADSVSTATATVVSTTTPNAETAEAAPQPPTNDPIEQGLWWLYQWQYDKARDVFAEYAKQHPDDPAGFFYITATDWWQLAQQLDYKQPDLEAQLERDYEKAAAVARAAYERAKTKKEKALASFYWGGAEGLWGRWLVTQRVWVKAYIHGKRGARYLRRALAEDPELYDAQMGLGIYDYFTDTLGGFVGAISGLLVHGDRKRGIRELKTVIEKGKLARVEAMLFLIEIYTSEEHKPELALPMAQQLHKEFPTSPAMYLAEIMAYYTMEDWDSVKKEAQEFLDLSEKQVPYYQAKGRQTAWYCLGVAALFGDHNLDQSFDYMSKILNEGIDTSRWITFAYLRRGQIYDAKGEREQAVADYKTVLSRPAFWGSHKEARQYLEKPFKQSDHPKTSE